MKYWIWLSQLPGIGAVSAKRLIDYFKNPEEVYFASEEMLKKVKGLTALQKNNILLNKKMKLAEEILEQCEEKKISLLTINSPQYPKRAGKCADAPILLYYKGKIKEMNETVGIVGARRCSQEVKRFVIDLVESYEMEQVPVVSGMAKGVDSYAHTACLKTGGYTIAIVANGLDICYPSEHAKLKECIEKNGLLLSEYPPGMRPTRYTFPRRNRLISAWSDKLEVVAAGKNSGALITAGYSKKYGREVIIHE